MADENKPVRFQADAKIEQALWRTVEDLRQRKGWTKSQLIERALEALVDQELGGARI